MGNVFILNANPQEREFLFKCVQNWGPVYVAPSADLAVLHFSPGFFGFVLIDAGLTDNPTLKPWLLAASCLILTGRREEDLKDAMRRWPSGRFVDYILISDKPGDLIRCRRVLQTAHEYARLKAELESLKDSKESAENKLKKASSEIKGIGQAISASLVKELEKRIAVETQYIRFRKLKQKLEDALRKLYAADDVSNLLDIVHDVKNLVHAGGISLYIREESETLGKYLKPLVWFDAVPSHADFLRHVAKLEAQDFASFVARTGQELNVTEPALDARFSSRYKNQTREPLQNILCSPLKHGGDVIGLIEVYNKSDGGHILKAGFNPEDQQILRGLSEHISIAITKLNLIQYDALTGLLRPDPFFEKVIQKIASRNKRRQETGSYAMVMGDVDWFKTYNDRNGHEAGNHLLRKLAGVMKSSIREDDLLCRYGGEEFLLFLTGVKNLEEAALLTERIRKNIEDHYFEFEEFQPRHNLTMSFGLTLFPRELTDERGTLTKASLKKIAGEADLALAEAKGKKLAALKYDPAAITKNKVCVYVRDKSSVMTKTALLKETGRKAFTEKRKSERYFTSTLCIFKENGSHRVAETIDLSLGGAKISSKTQFFPAKTLHLFLILGNLANPFKGDVAYSQKASPDSVYFYTGLKFRDLTQADSQILRNYFLSLENKDASSA